MTRLPILSSKQLISALRKAGFEDAPKRGKGMELYLIKYLNKMLKKAKYEYDQATNSWCASVDELPGVYSQADTIEDARSELGEVIEEYVFVSLQEGHPLPEFRNFSKAA